MKFQDILFLIVFFVLCWKNKPEWFVWLAITCLIVSIPLFSFWVFFTAQRLVYYAFFLLFAAVLLFAIKKS